LRLLAIFAALLAQAACAAGAGAEATLAIEPGKITEFRVELPSHLRELAGKNRLAPISEALVAVAVPENFDAARPWPMLIVSASQDPGYNSSRELMRGFAQPALDAGWIVLAADPSPALTDQGDDTTGLRYALAKAALSGLARAWPDSTHWPIAFGGFSGGSKRSGALAFLTTVEGRAPIGMFLGGCTEPTPALSLEGYGKPLPDFLKVPVFLSSGDHDKIATPQEHRDVQRDLLAAGFKQVRLETYAGRHQLSASQVRTALEWFAAEHGKP